MQQNIANNNRQNQNQFGWWSFIRMVLLMVCVNSIIKAIFQPKQSVRHENINSNINMNMNGIRSYYQSNAELNMYVNINHKNTVLYQNKIKVKYSLDQPQIDFVAQLNNLQQITQNITITTKFVTVRNGIEVRSPIDRLMQKSVNLTKYLKAKSQKKKILQTKQSNQTVITHKTQIPKQFNIFLVYSQMVHPDRRTIPPQLDYIVIDEQYLPIIDMSQMHIGSKHYAYIQNNNTVNLHFFCYSQYKFMLFYSLSHKLPSMATGNQMFDMLKQTLQAPEAMDELKQVLFENNIYLVAITMILSILHTIFEFMAIKNNIEVWNNLQKYQGLSIKSLYSELVVDIVCFLYFLDNQTSKSILYPAFISIFVTMWKIFKSYKFKIQFAYPFIKVENYEWYNKTQGLDNQAVKYLYYVLIPLFSLYTIYAFFEGTFKGIYSFILQTLVGFVYIFGFINMTPQLYVNYKLKSVKHMPWKLMVYKFLNTIIDDLFAFLVTMPWLKRLSCFRDDVIFIAFLYQKAIYKTDYTQLKQIPKVQNTIKKIN